MSAHAEVAEQPADKARRALRQHVEDDVKEDADKQRQQERHDLIIRNAAGVKPDADVSGRHQYQPEITRPHGAVINMSQLPHGEIIGKSQRQRYEDKNEARYKF